MLHMICVIKAFDDHGLIVRMEYTEGTEQRDSCVAELSAIPSVCRVLIDMALSK